MSEIKKPLVKYERDGKSYFVITPDHTLADIVRHAVKESSEYEVFELAQEMVYRKEGKI